jgi:GNAT superfamily N-acetyltransferase
VGEVHAAQRGVLQVEVVAGQVTVRPARPDDAGTIAEIQLISLFEAFAGHVPVGAFDRRDLPVRREWWVGEIAARTPRSGVLVAEADGEVGGFVRIGPTRDGDGDPEATGEVMAIFVARDRLGRGVGRALLGAAETALREAGFAQATLWIAVGNERARRFYEAAGWRLDGAEKLEPVANFQAPCVRYRAELATAPSAAPSP